MIEIDDLTDEITELSMKTALSESEKKGLAEMRSILGKTTGDIKGHLAKGITQKILEKKGFEVRQGVYE